jgi:hypothetical protein
MAALNGVLGLRQLFMDMMLRRNYPNKKLLTKAAIVLT